jgi:hypothetical protein
MRWNLGQTVPARAGDPTADKELVFEDIAEHPLSDAQNPARAKRGFSKVKGTCTLAANDGFDWVWIDSCCIDKSSSAELQEAINAMFRWYHSAQTCYVYLSDVPDEDAGWKSRFSQSQWFLRAWTLQELLAFQSVEFYAADWSFIGTKRGRFELLSRITAIRQTVFHREWGSVYNVIFRAAEKMSWAAHRTATRAEDRAYCLLGLFNVHLPLLYGEGERNAFRRLQQAIYEQDADSTLFLFSWSQNATLGSLFVSTPDQFCRIPKCVDCSKYHSCFPQSIPYSELESAQSWRMINEDDYFIKLIRQGTMIKLSIAITCDSVRRGGGLR